MEEKKKSLCLLDIMTGASSALTQCKLTVFFLEQYRLKIKASALKDPTATDTLSNLIPTSRAEEALVRKAGSKVGLPLPLPLPVPLALALPLPGLPLPCYHACCLLLVLLFPSCCALVFFCLVIMPDLLSGPLVFFFFVFSLALSPFQSHLSASCSISHRLVFCLPVLLPLPLPLPFPPGLHGNMLRKKKRENMSATSLDTLLLLLFFFFFFSLFFFFFLLFFLFSF